MLGTVAVSLRTADGETCEVPVKSTSLTLSSVSPNACFVASMLRVIDTDSRSLALGATTNCCRTCGHAAPTSTLEITSSTVAIAGSCRLRRNTATKNAAAQMIEMKMRISLAGITALRSV